MLNLYSMRAQLLFDEIRSSDAKHATPFNYSAALKD